MDRRVQYTKKVITETFLDLLEKKDISSITVTEICKGADINRGTFYRYYQDQYDLLRDIENNFIETVKNTYKVDNLPKDTVPSFSKSMLELILSNKKLIQILFNTDHNAYFLTQLLEIAYDNCLTFLLERIPDVNERDLGYALVFSFNGALGVINYWIKNDFQDSIDYISSLITACSKDGIDQYLK